ncbi:MAG: DNA polymerase/3'-5' exonuclease PolX [Bacillota bacterium]
MHNVEIARAFYELADLLELKGDNFFKIRAYRQAAKTIAGLDDPVEEMYRQKTLARIPGIGKNIISKIGELVEKGKMDKLEKLRAEIPTGLLEIMALPGIGPKRAGFLYQSLGITSLDELEQAARERKIRFLKGMGAKTETEILSNVKMIRNRTGKFLLGVARELAQELSGYLEEAPGVVRVAVAGSVRRWREMVEDVDLLAACRDFGPVLDALARHPRTREVILRKENYIRVMTWWGIPVELVTVSPENFWTTLLWETGSEGHLEELARHAREDNWELTPEGLKNLDEAVPFRVPGSEEDIYSLLKLKYIPPELREGAGEVVSAGAGALPDLVGMEDIRGDLHLHSQWSDGAAPIGDIVDRAQEKGYSYVAITDHSQSLKIARGLSPERLAEQFDYIDRLNRELNGFTVLKGVEVDILARGDLDFAGQVLERADVVVASVHTGFKQGREKITARILEAVRNRHVDIIGHLTGRLLGQREAYNLDVEGVLEEAGKHGKIMEINASPDRLDLNEKHARRAVDFGARIAINTDAHDLRRMDEMEYGVAVARRAGLEAADIVNTLPLDDLMKILNA